MIVAFSLKQAIMRGDLQLYGTLFGNNNYKILFQEGRCSFERILSGKQETEKRKNFFKESH
jgi:hypothetical protein